MSSRNQASLWLLVSVNAVISSAFASESQPLTATYRITRAQTDAAPEASYEWKLHRSESCVIAYDERTQVGDQWLRDEAGRIWYKRIFHKEKKVIEYQPAELGIGGIESKWSRLRSVIEPAELQSMQRQEQAAKFGGRSVDVYSGTRQGKPWEVSWLAAEQLPVRVSLVGQGGATSSLALIDLNFNSSDAASCNAELAGYEAIDFADIGDRQGDPFIMALMKYEGMSHGHGR